jgi:malate dehydrogenase (oxaloacetate-decarboxylating)
VYLPDQINNLLAFPRIFWGALDIRVLDISQALILASEALADLAGPHELGVERVRPSSVDVRGALRLSQVVAAGLRWEGLTRV